MVSDLEGVKALISVYMEQIGGQLTRLSDQYETLTDKVAKIDNSTVASLARMEADINNLGNQSRVYVDEIKSIKLRLEIHEDVEQEKWAKQQLANHEQAVFNDSSKKRSARVETISMGAALTLVGVLINAAWDWVVR